jgi:hypothetical protein
MSAPDCRAPQTGAGRRVLWGHPLVTGVQPPLNSFVPNDERADTRPHDFECVADARCFPIDFDSRGRATREAAREALKQLFDRHH